MPICRAAGAPYVTVCALARAGVCSAYTRGKPETRTRGIGKWEDREIGVASHACTHTLDNCEYQHHLCAAPRPGLLLDASSPARVTAHFDCAWPPRRLQGATPLFAPPRAPVTSWVTRPYHRSLSTPLPLLLPSFLPSSQPCLFDGFLFPLTQSADALSPALKHIFQIRQWSWGERVRVRACRRMQEFGGAAAAH